MTKKEGGEIQADVVITTAIDFLAFPAQSQLKDERQVGREMAVAAESNFDDSLRRSRAKRRERSQTLAQ